MNDKTLGKIIKKIGIDKVYDKEYVKKIKEKEWRYKDIPSLVGVLDEWFKSKSVIDFGCANGLHIKEFKKRGYDTIGIEGSKAFAIEIIKNYDGVYLIHDIRDPLNLERKFDLAICIEVLEHLEEKYADRAVKNLCRHSDVLCVTASNVYKKVYHINAQPKEYWIEKFESVKHFRFMAKETEELELIYQNKENMPIWMRNDLMIFRNNMWRNKI